MDITAHTIRAWAKGYRATVITTVIEGEYGSSVITFPNVYSASMFAHMMLLPDELTGPAALQADLMGAVRSLTEQVRLVIKWNPAYGLKG